MKLPHIFLCTLALPNLSYATWNQFYEDDHQIYYLDNTKIKTLDSSKNFKTIHLKTSSKKIQFERIDIRLMSCSNHQTSILKNKSPLLNDNKFNGVIGINPILSLQDFNPQKDKMLGTLQTIVCKDQTDQQPIIIH